MRTDAVDVEVGGASVRLSSLNRVLWPLTGTTKADLVRYYARVAPVILPHLAGHPLTLHRFPEGVDGSHFFQTRAPSHPPWVRTVTLSMPRSGKVFECPVIDDTPGLLWAANLSAIELHPFLGRVDALDRPTALVFDLDPGRPADIADACRVALLIREVLSALGLESYPKVSGGNGLHIHVPLDGSADYSASKLFARALARELASADAGVTDTMTLSARKGRVFVDWSQNDPGKSTIAPYSLRGEALPTVAAPVTWEEVERAAARSVTLVFGPAEVLERLERMGDLSALCEGQALPEF
jgi:bifunctional non-homologous end joining protein LigD